MSKLTARSTLARLVAPACLTLSVVSAPAFASNAIVPDAYATITAAIASGADSVSVRPGTYLENVSITRGLVLRGEKFAGPASGHLVPPPPTITAVNAALTSGALQLFDLRVTTPSHVSLGSGVGASLVQGCRFDSGLLIDGEALVCDVENCMVFGNLSVGLWHPDLGMNTVIGGSLLVGIGRQGAKTIHDNAVLGPAAIGISAGDDCILTNNYVRGCFDGILVTCATSSFVGDNIVEGCGGAGYRTTCTGSSNGPDFIHNVARRIGGRGFDLSGLDTFDRNTVDSTGQEGVYIKNSARLLRGNTVLRAGTTGISMAFTLGAVSGNTILGSGADGLSLGWGDSLSNNVVGRSQGRGIVTTSSPNKGYRVHHNTVYANGGAGFDLFGGGASEVDSIGNNIGADNAVGLNWFTIHGAVPNLGCNDWFANVTTSVSGASPGASDLAVDPLFCNMAIDDVQLSSGSPLVNAAGCGLIGARGVGCAAVAWVPAGAGARSLRLSVSPQPGHGPVQFSWDAGDAGAPGAGPATLEIYDVSGARKWSSALKRGQSSVVWSGDSDSGQALAAGVYFARLTRDGARSDARVVVLK